MNLVGTFLVGQCNNVKCIRASERNSVHNIKCLPKRFRKFRLSRHATYFMKISALFRIFIILWDLNHHVKKETQFSCFECRALNQSKSVIATDALCRTTSTKLLMLFCNLKIFGEPFRISEQRSMYWANVERSLEGSSLRWSWIRS